MKHISKPLILLKNEALIRRIDVRHPTFSSIEKDLAMRKKDFEVNCH